MGEGSSSDTYSAANAYEKSSRWPIGRERMPDGNGMVEEMAWVGKPWRRIELLTHRFFWKGEETERSRTLTFHLGQRHGGFNITLILARGHYDYSEESNV